MKLRLGKRLINAVVWQVVLSFLYSNVLWAVSARSIFKSIAPRAVFGTGHNLLTGRDIYIPEQYGTMCGAGMQGEGAESVRTVILIKDAHCVYEAQKNIGRILDILIRDYKIGIVCVEGAEGSVDTGVFQSMPDKTARERASDVFVKKGLLTASEALSIARANELPFTIWGVEDKGLYAEDLKLFRDTYYSNKPAEEFINWAGHIIGDIEGRIYNPALLEFAQKRREYQGSKLGLTEYIMYLAFRYGHTAGYKDINRVVRAAVLERYIDYDAAERDRKVLIRSLQNSLPKEDVRGLVEKSLLFRLGKISPLDYYKYLFQYVPAGMRFRFYADRDADFLRYFHLLKLQSQIDEEALFRDLDELEWDIAETLAKERIEKELYRISYWIDILDGLIHLRLSREQLGYYNAHKGEFGIGRIKDFLSVQAGRFGLVSGVLGLSVGGDDFVTAEEFYRLAKKRDRALVENLLEKMGKDGEERAVMVAGGFHSEGIRQELEAKGIRVIEITPAITGKDKSNPYLGLMLSKDWENEELLPEDIALPSIFKAQKFRGAMKELAELMFDNTDSSIAGLRRKIRDPKQLALFDQLVRFLGITENRAVGDMKRMLLKSIWALTDDQIKKYAGADGADVFAEYLAEVVMEMEKMGMSRFGKPSSNLLRIKMRVLIENMLYIFIDESRIFRNAYKKSVKEAAKALVDSGAVTMENVELIKKLLADTAEKSDWAAENAFLLLKRFADYGLSGKINIEYLRDLLCSIVPDNCAGGSSYVYLEINRLFEVYDKEGRAVMDKILDIRLLKSMAENLRWDMRYGLKVLRIFVLIGITDNVDVQRLKTFFGTVSTRASGNVKKVLGSLYDLYRLARNMDECTRESILDLNFIEDVINIAGINADLAFDIIYMLKEIGGITKKDKKEIKKLFQMISETKKRDRREAYVSLLDCIPYFTEINESKKERTVGADFFVKIGVKFLGKLHIVLELIQPLLYRGIINGNNIDSFKEFIIGRDSSFFRDICRALRDGNIWWSDLDTTMELFEGGNNPSVFGVLSPLMFLGVDEVWLNLSLTFPAKNPYGSVKIPVNNNLPFNIAEAEDIKILGRTLIIKLNGKCYAIKFKRSGENTSDLIHEHRILEWIKRADIGGKLRGRYPIPVKIDGNEAVRLPRSIIPEEWQDKLVQVSQEEGYRIDMRNGKYTVICYKVEDEGYFKYLNRDDVSEDEFSRGMETALWDLGVFARCGIVDTALIELFHNVQAGRKYLWMVDIIAPMGRNGYPMTGAGRLHAWRSTVRYPNVRLTGLADTAELRTIDEIIEYGLLGDLERKEDSPVIATASYLGDYILSGILMYGDWLIRTGQMDKDSWRDRGKIEQARQDIMHMYKTLYDAFTGKEVDEDTLALINWDRLVKQVLFYMSGAYREYIVNKNVPKEICGEAVEMSYPENLSISGGWGYIDKSVLIRDIGDEEVVAHVIDNYLRRPQANRQISPTIYQVNDDIGDISDKVDRDNQIPQECKEMVKDILLEYHWGWRFDGINEDLGPVNGPNPLTELTRSLYIITAFMAADMQGEMISPLKKYKHNPFLMNVRECLLRNIFQTSEQRRSLITYHNERHINELLGFCDGVLPNLPLHEPNKSENLIRLAGYLHDLGYYIPEEGTELIAPGHEDRGIAKVKELRRELGLTDLEAEIVCYMIDKTKMKMFDELHNEIKQGDRVYLLLERINNREELNEDNLEFLNKYILKNFPSARLDNALHCKLIMDAIIGGRVLAAADIYGQYETYPFLVALLWEEFQYDKEHGNEKSPAAPDRFEQVAGTIGFTNFVTNSRLKYILDNKEVPNLAISQYIPKRLKQTRDANLEKMRNIQDAINRLREGDSSGRGVLDSFIEEGSRIGIFDEKTAEELRGEVEGFITESAEKKGIKILLEVSEGRDSAYRELNRVKKLELTAEEFNLILDKSEKRVFNEGSRILEQGTGPEQPEGVFIIKEGTVKVELGGWELKQLHKGDIFGEIAVIRGCPRTATVTAVDKVTVYWLSNDVIKEIYRQYPAVKERLDRLIQEREEETAVAENRGKTPTGNAVIPSIQKKFGRFGESKWYKYLVSSVIEEILFRGGVITAGLLLMHFLSNNFALAGVVAVGVISIVLFVFMHNRAERNIASVVGITGAVFVTAGLVWGSAFVILGTLVLSILIHTGINILKDIRAGCIGRVVRNAGIKLSVVPIVLKKIFFALLFAGIVLWNGVGSRYMRETLAADMAPLAGRYKPVEYALPQAGWARLFIGHDIDSINGFAREVGPPGGVVVYTSVQRMQGIYVEYDYGSGSVCFDDLARMYPDVWFHVGLYMGGAEQGVVDGEYDGNLEKLVHWITELNRPVLLRIGYEFDNPDNGYQPDLYKKAFVYVVHYLRKTVPGEVLGKVRFVWHSYALDITEGDLMRYYPGDENVDIVGVSCFGMGNFPYMDVVKRFAKKHNKPMIVAEAAYNTANTAEWRRWFSRLLEWMGGLDLKVLSYINVEWQGQSMWHEWPYESSQIERNEDIESIISERMKNGEIEITSHSSQIGKKSLIEIKEKDGRIFAEMNGRKLLLTEQDGWNRTGLIEALKALDIEKIHGLIEGIINLLPRDVRFYTFTAIIGDVFGRADPVHKVILLDEALADNPIAVFHEIAEYLAALGLLHLEYAREGEKAFIIYRLLFNGREETGRVELRRPDAAVIVEKGIDNPHYLLRDLQREVFGYRDRDLTLVIKAGQLIRDIKGLDGVGKKQKQELEDKIAGILEKINRGEGLTEEDLKIDIPVLLNSGLDIDTRFRIAGRIVGFVNSAVPKGYKGNRGRIVAVIEQEIMSAIRDARKKSGKDIFTDEKELLGLIREVAKERGIAPDFINSVYDMLEMGIHIIVMNPEKKIAEIDPAYIDLADKIAWLSGVDKYAVYNAFAEGYIKGKGEGISEEEKVFIRRALERPERRVSIEDGSQSDTAHIVNRLDRYLSSSADLDLDLPAWLEGVMDFRSGSSIVQTGNNNAGYYLSAYDAMEQDTDRMAEAAGLSEKVKDPIAVAVSWDMVFGRIEKKGVGDIISAVQKEPGLLYALKRYTERGYLIIYNCGDKLELTQELISRACPDMRARICLSADTGIKDYIPKAVPNNRIVVNAPKEEAGSIKSELPAGAKLVEAGDGTALFAVMLFSIMYAAADGEDELRGILTALGIPAEEAGEMIDQLNDAGYFTLRLIRIKDTLEEFRSRQITIDVAA